MALDPSKFNNFRRDVDQLVEALPVENATGISLMQTAFGEFVGDLEEFVEESRPPRLYIFGRSGAGKSSMINALSGKEVAEVGKFEPTTIESSTYNIPFPDRYASWDVVDSRGLFESVSPGGELPEDTVEFMRQDLRKHRPDVLLHVMTPDQVRAGKEDFDTVKRLRSELGPIFPPVVYCLNKVDTHKKPDGAWPPEKNPELAGTIKENLDFAASVLGEEKKTPLRENQPLYGYQFDSENHIGIVPVSLIGNPWNVEDTLSWLVGDFLPNDARLQFGQGPGREDTIRRMCRDLTNRAAVIGAGVGATPAPVADMPVLLGIQGLLIGMIGALSCRSLSIKTVMEYTSVMGGTFALATAARAAARALIQLVPIGGWAVSAAIAYVTTYAIGRSAEVYYFEGKKKKPWKFMKEAIGKLREREEE